MKILSLETVPSSQQGGMEWSTLEVCRGLYDRGHEIHLVHKEDGDFLPLYSEFCTSITQTRFHEQYITHPIHSAASLAKGLLPLIQLDPDVVYIQKYQNSFFGALIARLKRVPLVCHLRAFPPRKSFNSQWSFGLNTVTRCIAVSEAAKQAYVMAGFSSKTIDIVYNGIDLDKFSLRNDRHQTRQRLEIPSEAFVALYAGRVDPPKNIEMLLRAFAKLQVSREAHLLIVGGPVNHRTVDAGRQYVESLKQLGRELGISARTHFLGKRKDLPALYCAADVTVLPSLLPDTFGRTLAESMACGTPAAGLRYGGIPEVISGEFAKFQFAVGDVNGLTRILESLQDWRINDPALALRCRRYAETRFAVDRTVAEVERVLEEAVSLGNLRLGPSPKVLQSWGERVLSNPEAFAGHIAW
jgi:glycosyltransferase involved in cell wall biosynthesis